MSTHHHHHQQQQQQQHQEQTHKYNLHAEVEAAKMSNANANQMAAAAAAAANSALSQAVQGAPLHALGLYGHHIWLGEFLPKQVNLLALYLITLSFHRLKRRT